MHAYILCQLDRTKAREVQSEVGSCPVVDEVNILFGEWDLIVHVTAQSQQGVTEFVIDELRSNDDIALTSTLIVAE